MTLHPPGIPHRASSLLALLFVAVLNPASIRAQQPLELPGSGIWPTPAECVPGDVDRSASCFQIVRESLVGKLEKERWRELTWDTFFSEGWNEAYAPVPHDVPRQTWINNADGAFYRLFVMSYSYADGGPGPIQNFSSILFTPFNRRFEIGWYAPWLFSAPDATGPGQEATFGDLTIWPRFLLHETKQLSVTANLYLRLPTGSLNNGNSVMSISPDVEFWANPVGNWVVRGGVGISTPLNGSDTRDPLLNLNPWTGFNAATGGFNTLDARLAIGQYITPSTGKLFGDFVYYLAANLHAGLEKSSFNYFSLTPGMRTGLGNDWYFLAGTEIPLLTPRPFTSSVVVQFIRNF